jgi:hypothetical protein
MRRHVMESLTMSKPKLKRTALTKPNMSYFQWRYVNNAKRTWRAWQTRSWRSDHVKQVAQEIRERGIVIGPATSYLSDEGRKNLAAASVSVLKLSQSTDVQAVLTKGLETKGKDYLVRVVPWDLQHSPDSPLLKVALDKTLLEIVSAYLGMWPRLHAIGAWLNFPTEAEAKEAQLWHRDPEDLKIVKVFIYLNDVDAGSGPFCYIPKTHPFSSGASTVPLHKDKKRILDDEMISVLPKDSWVTCTGPANTMILADTVGFHRGGKPTAGTRLLITFTYTSGKPFVRRVLQVVERPTWIDHPIQNYAL